VVVHGVRAVWAFPARTVAVAGGSNAAGVTLDHALGGEESFDAFSKLDNAVSFLFGRNDA
jgi:hypothetical protein